MVDVLAFLSSSTAVGLPMDNDTYYIGTESPTSAQIDGGWPLVRTWMSMVGLSCGAAITSDPWHWDSFKPYWRNVEVMTPPAKERTEVLDLCTSQGMAPAGRPCPARLGRFDRGAAVESRRHRADRHAGLCAGRDEPEPPVCGLVVLGQPVPGRGARLVDNAPAGPSASQHLVFTDLDRTPNRPVFIGSNLHI